MDPTKMLEHDHRQVEALFEAIEKAEGRDRQPLINDLSAVLRAHMILEEQVLYPAMAPIVGDEAVEEGIAEHHLALTSMEAMLELAPDEPGFGAALDATRAGIKHHVDEEENEIFPRLREDGTVLSGIATSFLHARAELGMPADADTLAAASTKDELLEEARAAGLERPSSMSKAELADSLASIMART